MLFMTDFVPYKQRDTYQLHGIPPVLQRNIQRRATKQNTSFANIVGQALSDRCRIQFTPSQRKHRHLWQRGDSLVIRVPAEVMECIRDEARDRQITIRSVILNSLSESFGLKPPPVTHVVPGREPGRKKGT